ncbi:MAG: hypothetical protein RL272_518 [Candidatus Parcubacteria bacterium]|jgi:hypothetical protein
MSKALSGAFRRTVIVVPFLWMLVIVPARAQTCPSAGAGTTCFGGQYFCPVNNQCYSDPRPCPGNLTLDCNACACTCDTATFPCGGCASASSAAGASCGGNASCPSGGTYQNQCSVVGCPSGTTICPAPAPGRCVANRTCPAGTTWDVCTDACGTPNVLLSPGFTQNGFISISGDVKSSAGNLRMDSASGANQGDAYFANGKAIRVDGSGSTLLTMANWGVGGTGFQLNVMGQLNGSQVCIAGSCRAAWPSSADFDPSYVNVSGDTMTGGLNITGAASDLLVAGDVGIGTVAPGQKLEVAGGSVKIQNDTSPNWGNVIDIGSATLAGGALIAGTKANDGTSGDLINLRAGSAPANRFRVTSTGQIQQTQTNAGTNGSLNIVGGTFGNGFGLPAGYDVMFADSTTGSGGFTAFRLSSSFGGAGTGTKRLVEFNAGGQTVVIDRNGYLGVGTSSPAARLSVGGSGANVYATDVWVENNMHVQGNETMAQGGGRGRLRVGTVWGYPGLYAEGASNGWTTDLVLGASSDHVLVNAASFGRPGAGATFELWGSRISDTGGGTLHIQSGGGVVAFDGGDTVVVNNNLQLGGVSRGSWPALGTTTAFCQFNAGSGAGWKACYCPSGYLVTGWYGYNCKNDGGEWECSSSAPYGSNAVQIYHDSAGTANVWAQCARVN